MASGASSLLPFLKLKFWHLLMPQLQVPLELVTFHLAMLALLEKYKNSIGEMQHHWLVFMSSRMGLTSFILPQNVEKFVLVGNLPVTTKNKDGEIEVNIVLYDLANGVGDCEQLIASSMEKVDNAVDAVVEIEGDTKDSGERVLRSNHSYISLPPKQKDGAGSGSGSNNGTVLCRQCSGGTVLRGARILPGNYLLKFGRNPPAGRFLALPKVGTI